MALQFTATINALEKGVTSMSPEAAVKRIENWEDVLQEVDVPGARSILRDLGALKRQLEQDEPDEDRIQSILSRLAESTTKIAGKVEDRNSERIRELGEALEEAVEGANGGGGRHRSNSSGRTGSRRTSSRQEEDEYQASSSAGSRSTMSPRYQEDDDYERRGSSGRVRDPESDRRLRGHESERLYESRRRGDDGRGRVTDPEHDHRLRGHESERLYEFAPSQRRWPRARDRSRV